MKLFLHPENTDEHSPVNAVLVDVSKDEFDILLRTLSTSQEFLKNLTENFAAHVSLPITTQKKPRLLDLDDSPDFNSGAVVLPEGFTVVTDDVVDYEYVHANFYYDGTIWLKFQQQNGLIEAELPLDQLKELFVKEAA